MPDELKVIGKNLPRKDAVKKATGAAQYTVDIKLPGMLHGKCLRIPYPHASILSIDTSKAEALPGVKAVVTCKDVIPEHTFKEFKDRTSFDMYILEDRVRYIRDEVAAMEPCGMYNVPRGLAFGEVIQRSAEKIGWKQKRHMPGSKTLPDGKKHGMGISGGNAALLQSSAIVIIDDRGSVNLLSGAVEQGQGAQSEMSQIVAEALGVPYDDVEIVSSDTGITPYDSGQDTSRTTLTHGNAVKLAAEDARQQLLSHAAQMLKFSPQDLECKEGIVFVKNDPEKRMPIADVVKQLMVDYPPAIMPRKTIVGKGSFFIPQYPPPAGNAVANIAEVEIDTATGQIELTRFISAVDCGRAISPQGIEGQYESVLSAGVGFALKEELLLEPGTGRVLNPTLIEYSMPTALDHRNMDPVIIVEAGEKLGPYGAKGIGECALSAAAPAISNAIYNAIGVRVSLPAMPDKVLKALNKSE